MRQPAALTTENRAAGTKGPRNRCVWSGKPDVLARSRRAPDPPRRKPRRERSARGDHVAADGGVLRLRMRDAQEQLAAAHDLPQVDMLDGVVRRGEAEGPSRAEEARLFERRDQ